MKKQVLFLAILCQSILFFWISGICWAQLPKSKLIVAHVNIAISSDVSNLDPNTNASKPGRWLLQYFCQPLVTTSYFDMSNQPLLAQSWEIINQKTWKINLQRGVKFHNGQALTSADVKFSFYRNMGRINRKYAGYMRPVLVQLIDNIETPDENTLIIHTKYPEASFLYLIESVSIVPKTYVEGMGDEGMRKNPVGTGPFMFKERKVAEHITLKANPIYWNINPLPGTMASPRIRSIEYHIMPQEATRLAALAAGEVDAIQSLSPDNAKELGKSSAINVYYGRLNRVQCLVMNWRTEKDPETGEPNPYRDVRVRQAMNYSIDINAIIKNYLTGRERRTTLVGYGAVGYRPDVPFYEFNPKKARNLLIEAGYPNGFRTTFYITTTTPAQLAIGQYLRDVGIRVEFNKKTPAVITSLLLRKRLYGIALIPATQGSDTVARMAKGWFSYSVL